MSRRETSMSGRDERNSYYLGLIEKTVNTAPDWMKQYLKGFKDYLNNLSLVTRYHYLLYTKMFLDKVNKPVEELAFSDFAGFLADMKYDENGKMTTSSHQVVVFASMNRFCDYLYKTRVIPERYVASMDRPKQKDSMETIEKRQNGYLNEREIRKLTEWLDDGCVYYKGERKSLYIRDRAIIQTFLNTGIRKSALIAIDVNNIDFIRQTLIVTDKEDKVHQFDLSDKYCGILKEWMRERDRLLGGIRTNALFLALNRNTFDGEKVVNGKRITETEVEDLVNQHTRLIKGKHITPHKLRATYGTQLYNKTGDLFFVQDCMGHSDPKTTERYIRGDRRNTKRASAIMAGLIH